MPCRAGARLPMYRRTESRAATSWAVQPGGRVGSSEGDGATDGDAAADGSTDAATEGATVGVADGATLATAAAGDDPPKFHCGADAAWHAATVAATPASPVTPAARRKPRRLSGDASRPSSSGHCPDVPATGSAARLGLIVGSTGGTSPMRGGDDWTRASSPGCRVYVSDQWP